MPEKTFAVDFKTSGFRRASRQMSKMGDKSSTAGSKMKKAGKKGAAVIAAIGTAVTGATAAMTALITKTTQYADEIDKASERTGVGREELQRLKFAAEQSGGSLESIESTASSFARRIARVEEGTGQASDAFDQLGVSLRDSSGQLRDQGDIYTDVLRNLAEMDNATRRASIGSQLFGRQFSTLMPLLNQGAGGIDELRAQADELGIVMGGENVRAFTALKDQFNAFRARLRGVGRELAVTFLPLIRDSIIPALTRWTEALRDVIHFLTNMSNTTKGIIVTVTTLTAAISTGLAVWAAWPAIIGAISTAFSGVATAATAAWAAITSPVTAVIAAIASVAGGAGLVVDNWSGLVDFFKKMFDKVFDVHMRFADLVEQLFTTLWTELKNIVAKGINSIIEGVNSALRFVGAEGQTIGFRVATQDVQKSRDELANAWADLQSSAGETADVFSSEISDGWAAVKDSTSEAVGFIQEQMASIGAFLSFGGGETEGAGTTAPGVGATGDEGAGAAQPGGGALMHAFDMIERMRQKMKKTKEEGLELSNVVGQGFNQLAGGVGRVITQLGKGADAVQGFAQTAKRALQQVIEKIIQAVIVQKLLGGLFEAIGGPVGGFLTSAIGVGEKAAGTEAPGAKVSSAGSATLAQGNIVLPVEVQAQGVDQGTRKRTRTGRRP